MSYKSGSINYPIEFMRIAGVLLITLTHTEHTFTGGIPFFILETLPKYGTPLLSVISGYLFYSYRNAPGLLPKKAKSLMAPYLIANVAVLLPVVVIYQFGFNYLDRLTYNYTLVTEGIFALNTVPINPPTYFIRDLFIVFCLLAVVKKDLRGLFFVVPLLLFGALLLRPDIAVLFTAGFLIKKFSIDTHARYRLYTNLALIPLAVAGFFFFTSYELHKYFIALLVFINVVPMKFTFARTGAFTYLLHLYHAPIIIFLTPFLQKLGLHPIVDVAAQVALAIFFTYIMFVIVKRLKLGVVVGHRL